MNMKMKAIALASGLLAFSAITPSFAHGGFAPGLIIGAATGIIAGAAIANQEHYYGHGGYYYSESCRQSYVRCYRDYYGYSHCYRHIRYVC